MVSEKAAYVIRYFHSFMTMDERIAHKHLIATAKASRGRTDTAAQTELRNSTHHLRTLLSDNPKVLQLTAGGLEQFVEQTAQRILDEHPREITFNRCQRCGAIARTPKARQCRFCGFDWHGAKSK